MTRKKIINRSILAGVTIGMLITTFAVLGSSSSQAAIAGDTGAGGTGATDAGATDTGAATAARVTTPPAPAVPAGQVLSSSFVGKGVQVYQCTAGAWVFVEPAATLTGRLAQAPWTAERAVHFRGPSWESTVDGSLVTAKAIANSPVTGSIPQLLLQSTSNRGTGIFGKVSYIQRLHTSGGAAPTSTCTDGDTRGVPYRAEYRFFTPAS